jgi:hypothetical protein
MVTPSTSELVGFTVSIKLSISALVHPVSGSVPVTSKLFAIVSLPFILLSQSHRDHKALFSVSSVPL